MQAWYLIYAKARQERVALENLTRQGYESYLPLVRGRRRRGGRSLTVVEPMFPRYLFVNLSDETDDWGPIRSTFGVSRLVRFGAVNATVPARMVRALRAREDEAGIQALPDQVLHPGERVRIVDGAMAGYEAIFQARSGRERVTLLLDMAGRQARVEVHEADIEPAAPQWTLDDRARC